MRRSQRNAQPDVDTSLDAPHSPGKERGKDAVQRLVKQASKMIHDVDDAFDDGAGDDTMDFDATVTRRVSSLTVKEKGPLRKLVSSSVFDILIAAVIVANSVTMALEQHFRLQGEQPTVLKTLENVFLCIYIVELLLRLTAYGWRCLSDNWVKFDVFLVLVGASSSLIIEPFLMGDQGESGGEMSQIMVLRSIRLLRLARMLRLLARFKELWMLVSGLLASASTMLYTLFLLFLILFIFSSIGFELITQNKLAQGPEADEVFQAVVEKYFPSLPITMLTLVQFICMDSIGAIYKPLIEKDGTLTMYFFAVLIVVPIVLMNLVTAVIVQGAMEQAQADKKANQMREDKKKKKLLKRLVDIFSRLDEDQSGSISRDEIALVDEEDMALIYANTDISNPLEVFDALDVDGDGTLDIQEFTDGIWQLAISKAPLEVQRMQKEVRVILKRQKEETENKEFVHASLSNMQRDLTYLISCIERIAKEQGNSSSQSCSSMHIGNGNLEPHAFPSFYLSSDCEKSQSEIPVNDNNDSMERCASHSKNTPGSLGEQFLVPYGDLAGHMESIGGTKRTFNKNVKVDTLSQACHVGVQVLEVPVSSTQSIESDHAIPASRKNITLVGCSNVSNGPLCRSIEHEEHQDHSAEMRISSLGRDGSQQQAP